MSRPALSTSTRERFGRVSHGLDRCDDLEVVARILEVQREKIARGEEPGPIAVDFWRTHRHFFDHRQGKR